MKKTLLLRSLFVCIFISMCAIGMPLAASSIFSTKAVDIEGETNIGASGVSQLQMAIYAGMNYPPRRDFLWVS